MALNTENEKVKHLLRRFGLGASEAEVAYYGQNGVQGAVDLLINGAKAPDSDNIPIELFIQQSAKAKLNAGSLMQWWCAKFLATETPLRERLTWFWHNHFATGIDKVKGPYLMYAQNVTLRDNCIGDFPTLLKAVAEDPAMILYLDNQTNIKGRPNENFAREVMELFTLGLGNYTETDIKNSARAFTGFSLGRRKKNADTGVPEVQFAFRQNLHDDTEKTFLGKTGNFNGEDILQIICATPQMPKFISAKMWTWFAYPNPEPELVERLAENFRSNNLSIESLVRSIMTAPEFYSEKAERAIYKSPIDFVVATGRQLGVGSVVAEAAKQGNIGPVKGILGASVLSMSNMGMRLFYPPNVAGWKGGADWVSTATLLERVKWATRLFGQSTKNRGTIPLDFSSIFANAQSGSAIAEALVSVFDAPLTSAQVSLVAKGADYGKFDNSDASGTAPGQMTGISDGAQLVFAAPQFQFA